MEKIDVLHPFSTILNGTNYVVMAQETFGFFKGQKLWCCMTSDILGLIKSQDMKIPNMLRYLKNGIVKNYHIITWFHNTYAPSIKLQFEHFDTTKEVWDLLSKCYSITNTIH